MCDFWICLLNLLGFVDKLNVVECRVSRVLLKAFLALGVICRHFG